MKTYREKVQNTKKGKIYDKNGLKYLSVQLIFMQQGINQLTCVSNKHYLHYLSSIQSYLLR